MVALYRLGRQAEALRAYQALRRALGEELGLEPNPALRELERQILLQSPELGAPAAAPDAQSSPTHKSESLLTSDDVGERKQVTVLSVVADVAADPDEWAEVAEQFVAVLRCSVERFDGHLERFTGDRATLLFGAPLAYEDHARRACAAALEIRQALAGYGAELHRRGMKLGIRLGLHSGTVVVGPVGGEYTALGDAARRAESVASLPGAISITSATAALVDGFFELRDLGGGSYELSCLGPLRTPLEVAAVRGFTSFVGRDGRQRRSRWPSSKRATATAKSSPS